MAASEHPTETAPTRRDWLGLAVLSNGLGLIVLDGTIVGVAGSTVDQLVETTRQSAGTTISVLRAGGDPQLGDQTQAAIDALATGFADGTRGALIVAVAFLVLGLISALFLRRSSPEQ